MTKDDKEMEDWFGRPDPKPKAKPADAEPRVYTKVGGKVARISGPEPRSASSMQRDADKRNGKGRSYGSGSKGSRYTSGNHTGFYGANDSYYGDNVSPFLEGFEDIDTAKGPPPPPKPKCYESHQPYEIAPGLIIHGGSGINPRVEGCDVYVSFDTARIPGWRSYPWQPEYEDFLYKIDNMKAPTNIGSFKKLLQFLADRLQAGKKVHIGCIGGHGRTGLVMAALRTHLTGDLQSAAHVRANYCSKAIETQEQIDFLKQHFDIEPVDPRYFSGKGLPKDFNKADYLPLTAPATTAPAAKVRVIRFDDPGTE